LLRGVDVLSLILLWCLCRARARSTLFSHDATPICAAGLARVQSVWVCCVICSWGPLCLLDKQNVARFWGVGANNITLEKCCANKRTSLGASDIYFTSLHEVYIILLFGILSSLDDDDVFFFFGIISPRREFKCCLHSLEKQKHVACIRTYEKLHQHSRFI
jgi:hypothetical protein